VQTFPSHGLTARGHLPNDNIPIPFLHEGEPWENVTMPRDAYAPFQHMIHDCLRKQCSHVSQLLKVSPHMNNSLSRYACTLHIKILRFHHILTSSFEQVTKQLYHDQVWTQAALMLLGIFDCQTFYTTVLQNFLIYQSPQELLQCHWAIVQVI
jgi:hypothetical protein